MGRVVRAFVVTVTLALALSGGAIAGSPALVIDVASGKVLYAERATDPWYPASITKLMTVYVALAMVRDGRASLDQLITISPEAASEPPSKMGFKPGTQLTLDNALKIIMVKSANDIAWAIGENLGGSVEGFAAMMNEAAHRLGMRESRWYNPNGLPDDRQQTSARDMAILGRALLRQFPEHRDLFSIGAIQFGRRIMNNHNGLIGRYPGADGMKTGFICASGFNVVASATRNGRQLITVVLGSPSAAERTFRAADLFDRGFGSLGWGAQTLDELPPSALLSPPNMRPYICERRGRMPTEEDAEPAVTAHGGPAAHADNPENPSINIFAPTTMTFASTIGLPGTPKRTLGPRAKFEPVRVYLGPAQNQAVGAEEPEEARAGLRAKRVRTKALARSAAPAAALPSAAQAFTATEVKPAAPAVETVRAAPRAASEAAIRPHLGAKPAAAKPRLGAIAAKPPVAAKPAARHHPAKARAGAKERKTVEAKSAPGLKAKAVETRKAGHKGKRAGKADD